MSKDWKTSAVLYFLKMKKLSRKMLANSKIAQMSIENDPMHFAILINRYCDKYPTIGPIAIPILLIAYQCPPPNPLTLPSCI
jgi:hypothetical protein